MNKLTIFLCVSVGLALLPFVMVYKLVKPTIDVWVSNGWRGLDR